MRRRTLAFLAGAILLGAGIVAAAQGPPENKGPVRTGYVVVTPTDGEGAGGLVVFETYGQKKGNGMTQAAVEGTLLTTHAVMFVSTNGRLSRNMGFAIANPNEGPATVTINLRGEDGLPVVTLEGFEVEGTTQIAQHVTEMFADHPDVVKDFTGMMEIVSDIPVAVVGLRFRGENFSTLPVTYLSEPSDVPPLSEAGGPGALILAHFAAGGGWASEIVLGNVGGSDLTVRVDIFGADGQPLEVSLNDMVGSSFIEIVIPAHGVYRLAPRENNGDDPF